jgi:hypothetical protein
MGDRFPFLTLLTFLTFHTFGAVIPTEWPKARSGGIYSQYPLIIGDAMRWGTLLRALVMPVLTRNPERPTGPFVSVLLLPSAFFLLPFVVSLPHNGIPHLCSFILYL